MAKKGVKKVEIWGADRPRVDRTRRNTARVIDPGSTLFGRKYRFPLQTGTRPETATKPDTYPDPPAEWYAYGTLPEWAIYWAHLQLGLQEGIDFVYRHGRGADDGLVEVDFFELELDVAVNIQGEFFHYGLPGKRAEDAETRGRLESMGIQAIYIDEWDAYANPAFYLSEALKGRDHSLVGRGLV